MNQHPAQALLDRERLEQDLALGGTDVEVAGDEVGEAARLIDSRQDLLDHLFRQPGLLAELGGPFRDSRNRATKAGSSG